jgi:hypothetical protein
MRVRNESGESTGVLQPDERKCPDGLNMKRRERNCLDEVLKSGI